MDLTTIDDNLTGRDYEVIAALAGCSRGYVQKIFSGKREVNTEVAKKVYELGKQAAKLNYEKNESLLKLSHTI